MGGALSWASTRRTGAGKGVGGVDSRATGLARDGDGTWQLGDRWREERTGFIREFR